MRRVVGGGEKDTVVHACEGCISGPTGPSNRSLLMMPLQSFPVGDDVRWMVEGHGRLAFRICVVASLGAERPWDMPPMIGPTALEPALAGGLLPNRDERSPKYLFLMGQRRLIDS